MNNVYTWSNQLSFPASWLQGLVCETEKGRQEREQLGMEDGRESGNGGWENAEDTLGRVQGRRYGNRSWVSGRKQRVKELGETE